ncbi:ATP-dependent helicase [Patescibacteria group bacterium]|nr:ATP-dependent helicase [Patescibacteria group bacterium]
MSPPTNLLEGLNDAQLEAVTHGDGPLLIVAGAGTGKTTVLTRRYQHLLQEPGMSTESILALTFTEKAAGEMEDRVLKLLPVGAYDFWISTFHGFCQRVLQDHGLEIGLSTPFRLLTPTDCWLLLRRHLSELPLQAYRPLGNPTKFLRALVQHISRAKDEGITPENYAAFASKATFPDLAEGEADEQARLQELSALYAAYAKIMREEGCLDFGDLLLETLRLLRERPRILEAYRTQFKHIFVDEFQDTNWAQYELVKLLAGKRQNLTVVGDDDQAIYKFRGASLANILQFRDDFPQAKTVALTKNYRSKKEILETAYTSITKNNPNRLEVKLADTGLSKRLEAEMGEGGAGTVELLWARSVEQEADRIIEQIERIKRTDPSATWNDFAILVRSNDGAEPFVVGLGQARIPFQFMALRGLYAKPVVIDLVALLTLLDTHFDSAIVWRVLTLEVYRLPAADVAELLGYANRKGYSLWSVAREAASSEASIHLSSVGRKILQRMVQDIQNLSESAHRSTPFQIFQLVLDKTGYLGHVLALPERDRQEVLRHVSGFADRIRRYEQVTHAPTLHGFLEEYRMEIESGEEGALDSDPEAEGPDMVKILTVHAAKGLEFRFVFVVSLVDQRFPTRARTEAIPLPDGLVHEKVPEGNAHLEEERRLFYVALTRAKERLFLSGAYEYGGARDKKPSSFLAEMDLQPPVKEALAERELVELLMEKPKEAYVAEAGDLGLYQLKRRFSFTQLAAFRKCALQYKYAHIYRIPTVGSYQRSFGQSIHLTFQKVFQLHQARTAASQGSLFDLPGSSGPFPAGSWAVSLEEALEIYQDSWIDEWYLDRDLHDEYRAKGKVAVERCMAVWSAYPPLPLELEKEFVLQVGGHSIKGKIDRVDQNPDGTVTVYDYKTGEAKDKLEAEDKEQLYLYQLALEGRGFKVSALKYLYVLDRQERDVELLTEDAKDQFLTKIAERMDAILHSRFEPTPEPFVCKYCDFRQICPFRKLA